MCKPHFNILKNSRYQVYLNKKIISIGILLILKNAKHDFPSIPINPFIHVIQSLPVDRQRFTCFTIQNKKRCYILYKYYYCISSR